MMRADTAAMPAGCSPEADAMLPKIARLGRVDRRTRRWRRYEALLQQITAPWGSLAAMPVGLAELARRGAGACLACEEIEAALASGNAIDAEQYTRLVNTSTRLLRQLEKAWPSAKPAAPSLAEIAADIARSGASIEADVEADK